MAGVAVSPVLLISDLGRPARFLNMLRGFKFTSPMSVGSWVFAGRGATVTMASTRTLVGRPRVLGAIGAALAGACSDRCWRPTRACSWPTQRFLSGMRRGAGCHSSSPARPWLRRARHRRSPLRRRMPRRRGASPPWAAWWRVWPRGRWSPGSRTSGSLTAKAGAPLQRCSQGVDGGRRLPGRRRRPRPRKSRGRERRTARRLAVHPICRVPRGLSILPGPSRHGATAACATASGRVRHARRPVAALAPQRGLTYRPRDLSRFRQTPAETLTCQ
jgi:hypothetical protein